MTTVEYAAWAEYADRNIGDVRTHQVLALIGSNHINSKLKQGVPSIHPSRFTPWIDWPDSPEKTDPLFHDRLEG